MRSLLLLSLLLVSAISFADEKSSTPYLDEMKREIQEMDIATGRKDAQDEGSFTEKVKSRLNKEDKEKDREDYEGYTDRLRSEDPKAKEKKDGTDFIDQEKRTMGPAPEPGGAIQAVHEGRSELHARKRGEIHHAAGVKVGASLTRVINAGGAQLRSFEEIYGDNYAPDVTFFHEYQPWHSEWYGSIGLLSSLGVSYFHGKGIFGIQLLKPDGVTKYPSESETTFQFFTLPITMGIDYRFNLARIIRPFVSASLAEILYYEYRNDDGDSHRGHSEGVLLQGGASILLDWISGNSSWDLYMDHGVKHYYLTVEYSRLTTFSGDVSMNVSGIYAGLTFEF